MGNITRPLTPRNLPTSNIRHNIPGGSKSKKKKKSKKKQKK